MGEAGPVEGEGAGGELTARVVDNSALHRYEIWVDETLAGFITYKLTGRTFVALHAETKPGFEHHGVASVLAHEMLDDVRRRGLRLVPRCPFVAAYVREHPDDFGDLVSDIA
jgi:predicted GNAT family acetyltransferase